MVNAYKIHCILTVTHLGLPSTAWKLKQQIGRVGRNGQPAAEITLIFPQKGTCECTLLLSIRPEETSKHSYCTSPNVKLIQQF